ncbi:glycosyltransferase [Terrabacter sp. MAHUQ-38]|uniref:glycosyltransferase n=1 Tax=unclassified Terrabacter TaxID=2630222 RepID=UPI00165E090E|nr:glycosyltransferase [Terrabacter sp. MAHUQ-38]
MRDLSVVVSAHGSCDRVAACLDSLAVQTLPADRFELVVVLHGPGTQARTAVEQATLGALAGHEVELVDAVAPSPGAARNIGVDLARAPWTTFVDGADTLAPRHLEALHAARHPERVAVASAAGPVDGPRAHVAPHRAVDALRGRGGRLYPTRWLVDTPFVETLCGGEDTVLHGQLLSRFDRQFTEVDLSPSRSGGGYVTGPSPELDVREHIAVVAALTCGTQTDPADRSAITNALVAAELADLRRAADTGPDDGERARVEGLLRAAEIAGVHSLAAAAHDGAADGFTLFHTPPAGPRSLVVVAGSAASVNEHARMLGFLARSGYGIRVLHYRGRLKQSLRKLPETHRVDTLPESIGWIESQVAAGGARSARRRRLALRASQEALRLGRRALPEVVPVGLAAPAYGRVDERSARLLAEPGTRIVLDRGGPTLLRTWGDDSPTVGVHELAALTLRTAASQLRGSLADAHAARRASRVLRGDVTRTRADLDPELWTMVAYRLQRAGRLEAAAQLLDDRTAVFGGDVCPALVTLQRILTGSVPATPDVVGAVGDTLHQADAALADDDVEHAAFLTTVALDLLFTRRLHTAEVRTPIVSEPGTFLAPLRESEVGRLLATRTTTRTPRQASTHSSDRLRVTVLPGAYPKFAKAVVGQLAGHADVEVLELAARQKRFANTGVDPVTVRERLLTATGHPPALDLATAEALSADVVFADWADKGLTWLTQVVPEGPRVVVRMHGVDTLSAWLHTAQWEKVDDVIFPSEHLRRAAAAALGGRLDGVRQHVVANPVDVERHVLPKSETARTTLGMVGWAQQVKDPGWTLDLLAALRRQDPRWRLRLIGADVDVNDSNPVERAAARAFHARLADPVVADAVDFVGYTSRLPEHLREVGWAVSSSRREGFHIGLVEMAASGAVPVVRDWPVYAGIGGATGLFPAEWVSTTPEEAAERILRISASGAWDEASAATVETVRRRFSGTDSGERLRRIVLGER